MRIDYFQNDDFKKTNTDFINRGLKQSKDKKLGLNKTFSTLKGRAISKSPIWCMDYCNDLIILGCADGRLEFWEVTSCKLMVSAYNYNF